jgi:hypothetical protein
MSDVLDPEALGEQLSEADLLAAGPLIEARTRILVPKRGNVLAADGTVKVAIIRPCVSRGAMIRGHHPIYTPQMLAESAGVFAKWLMYMDHVTPDMAAVVKRRGRSMNELGGRLLESYWDPEFRHPEDDDHGYRPGAVIGRALPQPPVARMIEADPEILQVSINAWPRAARVAKVPWDQSKTGMLIEGIRDKPQGSVDWVPRGGAGGRVLPEVSEAAVTLIESYYDACDAALEEEHMPDLKNVKTLEELRESLRDVNPQLAESLSQLDRPGLRETPVASLQESDVEALIEARLEREKAAHAAELEAVRESAEQEIENRLQEAREFEALEESAQTLIRKAGLPPTFTSDLQARYAIKPQGVPASLRVTATDELTEAQVLENRVKADIEHARALLLEADPGARVSGLGASRSTAAGASAGGDLFDEFMQESYGKEFSEDDMVNFIQEGVA